MKNPFKKQKGPAHVHREAEETSVLPPHYSEYADVIPKPYGLPAEFVDAEDKIRQNCKEFLSLAGKDAFTVSYYDYQLVSLYLTALASLKEQKAGREAVIRELERIWTEDRVRLEYEKTLLMQEQQTLEQALVMYQHIAAQGTVFEAFCPAPSEKEDNHEKH